MVLAVSALPHRALGGTQRLTSIMQIGSGTTPSSVAEKRVLQNQLKTQAGDGARSVRVAPSCSRRNPAVDFDHADRKRNYTKFRSRKTCAAKSAKDASRRWCSQCPRCPIVLSAEPSG